MQSRGNREQSRLSFISKTEAKRRNKAEKVYLRIVCGKAKGKGPIKNGYSSPSWNDSAQLWLSEKGERGQLMI